MVRIEKVDLTDKMLDKLAGSLSERDADLMLETIKKARGYRKRKVLSFD